MRRNTPVGLSVVGFQTASLSNSTAVAINSTCLAGKIFHVSVETNNVRYRADSTAPTLSTGVLLPTGFPHWLFDVPSANLKFQRSTGTAKISIMAFKYVGL